MMIRNKEKNVEIKAIIYTSVKMCIMRVNAYKGKERCKEKTNWKYQEHSVEGVYI